MAAQITVRDFVAQFENWSQDKAGLPPADSGWFAGAVYEQYMAARATDILESYMRDPEVPDLHARQTIGCMALAESPVEECPCAPPSGCTWWKSVMPVPDPIGRLTVTGIGGNLAELQNYIERDWTTIKYALASRIPAERSRGYFFIRNNHLYLVGQSGLKAVAVTGIFRDPVEVQRTDYCSGQVNYCQPFLDFPIYVDPGKLQKITAATYQLIGGIGSAAGFDTTNNAQPAVQVEVPGSK